MDVGADAGTRDAHTVILPYVGQNDVVSTSRTPWVGAGILAGFAGLATSYAVATVLGIRESPVVAVAELVIQLTPGPVVELAIGVAGQADKPALVTGVLVALLGCFALAGLLARSSRWQPIAVWTLLAGIGLVAVSLKSGVGAVEVLPVIVGLLTWVTVHSALIDPLRREQRGPEAGFPEPGFPERRVFLKVAGVVAVATIGIAAAGRWVGAGRRRVAASRRLLRIDGVTRQEPPTATMLGMDGITPWRTPNEDFYLIDTAISVPSIEPEDWSLRIHGLVDREITLSFGDLVARRLTESWITLSCVSNEVGGDLVGNARWSGVRVADLLAEAGVREGADCVRQTSHDDWDCVTPLGALTDDRDAMLAVAMNGAPLPLEHGFPVRTIVPGLYGYVSATKWVVDFEVARFDEVEGFWTQRGWSALGPAKIASRIDVPRRGQDVAAGRVSFGGVAWHPHTGISRVEIALDGGDWQRAELGGSPSDDTWVQWALTLDVPAGEHTAAVRATGRDGETQTGVRRDVIPDGSTGWHSVTFTAED